MPIEGAAGVGYVLRRGYDLPPLMFTADEVEAVLVGMRLLRRTRDPGLQQAADSVLSKLAAVLPEPLRGVAGYAAVPCVRGRCARTRGDQPGGTARRDPRGEQAADHLSRPAAARRASG